MLEPDPTADSDPFRNAHADSNRHALCNGDTNTKSNSNSNSNSDTNTKSNCDGDTTADTNAKSNSDTFACPGPSLEYLDAIAS